jgi:hypothetical protein
MADLLATAGGFGARSPIRQAHSLPSDATQSFLLLERLFDHG